MPALPEKQSQKIDPDCVYPPFQRLPVAKPQQCRRPRARMRLRRMRLRLRGFRQFRQFSSQQGLGATISPGRRRRGNPLSDARAFPHSRSRSGETELSKAYVSLALTIALGAGAPALATAAPTATASKPAPAAQAPQTRAALLRGLDTAFKTIDANGDGSISAAEAQATKGKIQQQQLARRRSNIEAEFTKLDTNKDGQLEQGRVHGRRADRPADRAQRRRDRRPARQEQGRQDQPGRVSRRALPSSTSSTPTRTAPSARPSARPPSRRAPRSKRVILCSSKGRASPMARGLFAP